MLTVAIHENIVAEETVEPPQARSYEVHNYVLITSTYLYTVFYAFEHMSETFRYR